MSAKVYHFCQHERKMLYLPSYNNYKALPIGTVLTECPSCGKPMKPVTVTGKSEGYNQRTGWNTKGNYKKEQQAKGRVRNIESEQQREARYARTRPYSPFGFRF